ncbi:MAG: 5'-3' exonuclease H3TH domain-containing protein [Thermovirgaceae bacterium]|nr:5'-3' exonuclease H3TH domain-containing protein [Thermovirgaceae bacterium]
MTDLILIDGHALAYRAYFGVKTRHVSPDGTLVNGVHGFGKLLISLIEGVGAPAAAVVFDSPAPVFRKSLYAAYKANRPLPPDDFIPQIPLMKEFVRGLGIKVLCEEGFEADDVIAAAAVREARRGGRVIIVTPDKDLFQILGEGDVSIMRPAGGDVFTKMDATLFRKQFGFEPSSMTDYQALTGDRCDNIPGVTGVGPVTATGLIRHYSDLESIYEKLPSITLSLRSRLERDRDMAFLSRELASLRLDAPIPAGFALEEHDRDGSRDFCSRNNLTGLSRICACFRPCAARRG